MLQVQHMVVVKFKPDVPAAKIAAIFDDLHRFWARTPGIRYFADGPYSSTEGLNQGFTHGFLVTFESTAARDAYLANPDHDRIKDAVIPLLDGVMAFDFETS